MRNPDREINGISDFAFALLNYEIVSVSAPPVSSNLATKGHKSMTEEPVIFVDSGELDQLISNGSVTLIDVREADEFSTGHIAGAINMPTSNFDIPALVDLADNTMTDFVFVCAVGQRSFGAANVVVPHLDCLVMNLKGGLQSWSRDGFGLVRD